MPASLLKEAAEHGIRIYLSDGKLMVKAKSGAMSDSFREKLKSSKSELIEFLERREQGDVVDVYPMSALQTGMVFHTQLAEFSGVYHDLNSEHVKFQWDRGCFEDALSMVIDRHPVLRTTFVLDGVRSLQRVHASIDLPLRVEDIRHLSEGDQRTYLEEWRESCKRHVFDWSRGPLWQVSIFLRTDDSFEFVLSFHHSILDGWSRATLTTELYALYERLLSGEVLDAPEVDWTYRQFIAEEQAALSNPEARAYFTRLLADAPEQQLPRMQRSPAARLAHAQARHDVKGIAELSDRLLACAQELGLPLQYLLLAVHFKVLSVLSARPQVLTCVVQNGRPEVAGAERSLGLFLNTLPSSIEVVPSSWRDLLQRVARQQADSLAYRHYPLKKIQDDTGFELAEVIFSYTHFHVLEEVTAVSGARLDWMDSASFEQTNFGFLADFSRGFGRDPISLSFTYDPDLFDAQLIERMGGYYVRAFTGMLADLDGAHVSCDVLGAQERDALLQSWRERLPLQAVEPIHGWFERQAQVAADAPALTYGDRTLSYGELNAWSNRIAHRLREHGVGPDVLVGLCVERSLEMVAGLLGILKAGGAYVPLDPGYPPERLRYMVEDSGVGLVLTQSWLGEGLPLGAAQALLLDEVSAFDGYPPTDPPRGDLDASHLAYVIYTSGSTGRPKGVMVEHAQVSRLLSATEEQFGFGPSDVWTMFHSYAFDFSVWELWGALAYGGRLVVVPHEVSRSPDAFCALLESEGVTVLNQTPTAFAQLSAVDARRGGALSLRVVVFGGEALKLGELGDWVKRHGDAKPQLVNMYGITETTVHVTYRRILLEDIESGRGSVIGLPLGDLRMYVLDAHGAVVPPGVPGELYVGGAGLARGYLHRAELTAERFVADPYVAGERLYRTGDQARWLPEGGFEYLGRLDGQVKVRGFRIELGEIEHRLSGLVGVQGSVVLVREDVPGDKRLVAYVAVGESLSGLEAEARQSRIAGYREGLSSQMPGYMVPSAYVLLESLPLTVNGKVDRAALPAPDGASVQHVAYEAPRDEVERVLCAVWSEVLGVERVGIHDNFFNIGGDSILSIRIVALLRQRGVHASVKDLFQHQTVATLAAQLGTRSDATLEVDAVPAYGLLTASERAALPEGVEDAYPLSALQAGMVFHTQLEGFAGVYHDVMSDHVRCAWEPLRFASALEYCVRRHPILRTVFDLDGERALQHVLGGMSPPLEVEDLRGLPEASQESHVSGWIERRKRHVFDWSRGPLFQVNVFLRTEESFEFVLSFHHSILDGWSRATLMTELYGVYQRLLAGEVLDAPEVDWTYRQFIAEEQAALSDPGARGYFAQMLEDAPSRQLPRQSTASTGGARRQSQYWVEGLGAHSEGLFALSRTLGVPVSTLLLAVHFKVLSALSGEAVALSTVTHNGRPEREGSERSLGLYLNSVPLALSPGSGSWSSLVSRVAEANARCLGYRQYPLSAIQKDTGRDFAEVTFNYTHFHVFEEIDASPVEAGGSAELEVLGSRSFEQTNFDFHVDVSRAPGSEWLSMVLNHDAEAYESSWVERVGACYLRAIEGMLADPEGDHAALDLLSPADRAQLRAWGQGEAVSGAVDDAVSLLWRGMVQDASAEAVVCGDSRLSYAALGSRASRLAHCLLEMGVGPGSRVGIYLPRCAEQVVAVLGVLMSGGSYVPLDVGSPSSRVEEVLSDAGVGLVLVRAQDLERLPLGGVDVLLMDGASTQAGWLEEFGDGVPAVSVDASSEAYVLYTSGSTGRPKGVRVTHGGLVNYLSYAASHYWEPGMRAGVVSTPLCFDATLTTLLTPLCVGGTVELVDEEPGWLDRLGDLVFGSGDALLFKLTPSHLDALWAQGREHGSGARHRLVVGGEQLGVEQVLRLARGPLAGSRFVNEYGPTETVVGCSVYELEGSDARMSSRSVVPIGRPIANTRLEVVDAHGGMSPPGSVGELYIGGAGVALGYVNRDEQTLQRFVDRDGERMYRTGDRVRWLESGDLEYVGRGDDQVKVRGYRVELGDVESALRGCAGVREGAVVLRDGRLVAYVVDDGVALPESYASMLRERLPEYMVPSAYVRLESLPLTVNGKLDRSRLPLLDGGWGTGEGYEGPRTEVERRMCAVWEEVLGVERVGIRDNFFSLGGDSILSIRIVALLKKEGIVLGVQDLFRHQRIAELAGQVSSMGTAGEAAHEIAAYSLLTEAERSALPPGVEDAYPLSSLQAGMVFHTQLEGFSGIYHDVNAEHVRYRWDRECFAQALAASMARHPILRTGFDLDGERPLQLVWSQQPLPLEVEDLRGQSEASQSQRLEQWLESRKRHVFDWKRGPLWQVNIFLRTEESFEFVVSFHHSILDGWSRATLTTELYNRYERLLAGGSMQEEEVDWTYRRFIALEQSALSDPVARSYFARMLADAPEQQLPRYGQRSDGTGRRERCLVEAFGALSGGLLSLSRRLGVPVQSVLLAGHFKVLGALSGGDRVMSCVVANGRPEQSGSERGLGLYLNSMPLSLSLDGGSWRGLIESVSQLHAGSLVHRRYPLSQVQRDLGREYAEVLFNYMHFHVFEEVSAEGGELEVLGSSGYEQTNFAFGVDVSRSLGVDELSLSFNYDAEMFDAELVERIGAYYVLAYEAMLSNPEGSHADCRLLTAGEQVQLARWNDTGRAYPDDRCMHEFFEQQAQVAADAPALTYGDRTLSYGELNAWSNRIAHRLREHGVGPDVLVGLCVERSLEMVAGLLGILKAGGAYVPLDPGYPPERLHYMVEDSGVGLVLTQSWLGEGLPLGAAQALLLDEVSAFDGYPPTDPPRGDLDASHLAYVIYTSGSTGRPKGVMIEHRGVVNYLGHAARHYFGEGHAGAVLSSSLSFDATVTTLWTPWLAGRRLVVLPEPQESLLEGLLHYLYVDGGDWVFKLTPSHLDWLSVRAKDFAPGQGRHTLVIGGEQLRRDTAHAWKAQLLPESTLVNEYGPTETVVGCSVWAVEALEDLAVLPHVVPIGRGIDNMQMHVLGRDGHPVPVGAAGELYIGGAGVGRGYLNRAELTAERFVADPYVAGGRLYRTGDHVRWLPQGTLEFIGRVDDQVKVRGFRIELGEIEHRLSGLVGVQGSVVLVREDVPGDKRLVAYVAVGESLSGLDAEARQSRIAGYREGLSSQMPGYMVPSAYVLLESLPLTVNGKVDRAALPAPDGASVQHVAYEAPRDEVERVLCEIYQSVLKIERVGIADGFFALGGDSILSMLVVSRANQAGIGITTRDVFTHQSVGELASRVVQRPESSQPQSRVEGGLGLLPIHRAFLAGRGGSIDHYNQSLMLTVPEDFQEDHLHALAAALVDRHDALRLRFAQRDGSWEATHADGGTQLLDAMCAVEAQPAEDSSPDWLVQRCEHYQRSLSLASGPLARMVYFRAGNGVPGRLLLVLHHLVVDGVSWRVLLGDLEQAHAQLRSGHAIALGLKTSSYQKWSEALEAYAGSEALEQERSYWTRQAGLFEAAVSAPFDPGVAPAPYGTTATVEIRLTQDETAALLKRCGTAYRTRLQELLLAGVYLGLRRSGGGRVQCVTMEGHGREPLFDALDTTQTVGWFTSTYPLVLDSAADTVPAVIKAVKEQCREVPNNGIGYGLLRHVREVPELVAADQGRLLPLMFNYLGQFDQVTQGSSFEVSSVDTGPTVDPARLREHLLGLNGMVSEGVLGFSLDYSTQQFDAEAMASLAGEILSGLREVIAHCLAVEEGEYTASDFPNARLTGEQLDQWQAQYRIERLYRATPMQQGMFFHGLLDRSAYAVQFFPIIEGRLDPGLFRRAWESVVARHDVLRTAFVGEGDVLHQLVTKAVEVPWQELDWRDLDEEAQQARFEAYRVEDRGRGFDFAHPPLLRLTLIRLGETRHRLLWSLHHMLLDGWCTPLVYRDVMQIYYGLAKGSEAELGAVHRYERYVEWLYAQDEDAARRYWHGYLAGVEVPSLLSSRGGVPTGVQSNLECHLDEEATARLHAFSKSQQTTLNALLQLAWGLTLRAYCDTDDVVFGTVVSGRPAQLPGMESMVGLFINTLPVRVSLGTAGTVSEQVRELGLRFLDSIGYGYLPLAEIQRQGSIDGGQALFDSLLVLENYPLDSALDVRPGVEELRFERVEADTQDTYPLTLSVLDQSQLSVTFGYDGGLFPTSFVEQLQRHFLSVLEQLPSARSVAEIEVLSPADRAQLRAWGRGEAVSGAVDDAVSLLWRGMVQDASAEAVVCGDSRLSYAALGSRASRLAHCLLEMGVGPGSRVGIYLPRCAEQVVAVLGVLMSGGSYVPLDVGSPSSRVEEVLSDAGVGLVLVRAQDLERLPLGGVDVLLMDGASTQAGWLEEFGDGVPAVSVDASSEAYVLYTSGSTGRPKGVRVTHGGLVNYLSYAASHYWEPGMRAGVVSTPLCFDATLTTLLTPLCVGGTVELVDEEPGWLDRLGDLVFGSGDALLFKLTPSHLDALWAQGREHGSGARHRLVVGGEQLGVEQVLRLARGPLAGSRFVNEYGPTETVVGCSVYELEGSDARMSSRSVVPIGRPIANTRLEVVDAHGGMSPPGSVGELYIGGAGVALGYVNRDEQTLQRFVDRDGERMYRTGDRVRWLESGDLEYVGRGDDQVKVRGYRVELGDVESALRGCAGVREGAVVLRDGRLVAYVVDDGVALPESYASMLRERLPEYMVPSAYVRLESLPLTVNGKLDRSRLPLLDGGWGTGEGYEGPRTEVERRMCAVWEEVLGVERVGIRDNFFSLGGDSILSIRIVALLKKEGIVFDIADLFRAQTIDGLVVLLNQRVLDGVLSSEDEAMERRALMENSDQPKGKRIAI